MKNITGPPVFGEDFFDREEQIQQFWELIESGHHILISAPRRVGKTSLMLQVRENPRSGYSILHLDTESINNENEFFRRLLNNILKMELVGRTEKVMSFFRENVPGVKKVGTDGIEFGSREVHNYNEILIRVLHAIGENGQTLIIMLDEFPMTLENIIKDESESAGRHFLGSNRELRQDPLISKNVRFVYTGSIGLENVVNRIHSAGSLMDLARLMIPPLSPGHAFELMDKLSKEYDFTLNSIAKEYIIDRIHWLNPFYIQSIIWELRSAYTTLHETITPERIDTAFNSMLEQRNHFEHWYDRLRKSWEGNEHNFAKELLNIASETGMIHANQINDIAEKYSVTESHRDIVSSLKYDGYIDNTDDPKIYRFNSPVVMEWWRKNVAN
ncbi:MAG: ATP-binding protein [Candidatus Marinimicrobia bacterium]|nr:ATP-binding protein [Candidatus Neomarinimicrobiota bacterium]